MLAILKSELRKLYTVRSTYVVLLLALAIVVLIAFYLPAFHSTPQEAQLYTEALSRKTIDVIMVLSLFCSIVGVLLVTHEYRYNTIVYTLTASRHRTKVFLAKFAAISIFAVLFALVFGALAPLLAKLGYAVSGNTLAPQVFDVWDVLWRSVFTCWGFFMFTAILAFIIRSQVGAIVAMFLVPSMVEGVLGQLVLRKNQEYLPFSMLSKILEPAGGTMSHGTAALYVAGYVVFGGAVAWLLFQKRDAN